MRIGRSAWPTLACVICLITAFMTITVSPAVADEQDSPRTFVLDPADATWTSALAPLTPQADTDYLRSSASLDSTYLTFDTSDFPPGDIVSATLTLTVRRASGDEGDVVVRQASPNWSPGNLTAATASVSDTTVVGTSAMPGSLGSEVTIALDQASAFTAGRQLSLRINQSGQSVTSDFAKLGSAGPRLTLTVQADSRNSDEQEPEGTVFAHYFPPYPISIDNLEPANDYYSTNYLTIDGENGKHAAYGGWLRDRPVPRSPIPDADWQVEDLETEVRQAKAAGIDGFTVDIMSMSGSNWTTTTNLMRAARNVGGFQVVPNLDATASVADLPPTVIAAGLADLYDYSSAGTSDGTYLLSSYAAEKRSPAWWAALISALEKTHDVPVDFLAIFLDASAANMKAFRSISVGFGNWGDRTAATVESGPDLASAAHALGRTWMAPVAFQDARHHTGTYAEAGNTETGRAAWTRAIDDDADYVQLVTWNDYTESTGVAPSVAHGDVLLGISSYYIDWFKSGAQPQITSDHLWVTHRIAPVGAAAASGIDTMRPLLGGPNGTEPRDTVEALVLLTSPATVSVTSGGITRSEPRGAGLSTVTVPLRPGVVSAEIVRSSFVVKSVTSPHVVTTSPPVQDLQYYAAGQ